MAYRNIFFLMAALLIGIDTIAFAGGGGALSGPPQRAQLESKVVVSGSYESVNRKQPSRDANFHVRNPRYRLQRGDSVDITFPFIPSFNQTLSVQPDGYISLHNLGDMYAEGMTLPELREALRRKYSSILENPTIVVELKDFEKPFFVAGGEVGRPGKYELREDTTVAQAIAIAGGFREHAKISQVLLFRRVSDDWYEVKEINLKSLLHGQKQNVREEIYLKPGDTLFVSKNLLGRIKGFIPRLSIGPLLRP